MIISASRRTDIPAFYSEWLMNRLKEGYVLIPNPRNTKRLGRVALSPEQVDCIVFWTKNPDAMLDRFSELDAMGYHFYVQFTLSPYDGKLEPNLPPKPELLQTFTRMSAQIGILRSVWRYDPIVLDAQYGIGWHTDQFASMCEKLCTCTKRCILSFVDLYQNMNKKYRELQRDEMHGIASAFSEIARKYDIALYTCAEEIDFSPYGIKHSACIDQKLIEEIIGCRIKAKKDMNQRAACCCIESVDIGAYDTCPHGCTYCYATASPKTVLRRMAEADSHAPMLTGFPKGDEIITDREAASGKIRQLSLF